MITVYIVTNPELGWDCIVEVFDSNEIRLEQVQEAFPEDHGYRIFERKALTEVELD